MADYIYQYSDLRFLVRKKHDLYHNEGQVIEIWDYLSVNSMYHLSDSQYPRYKKVEFVDTDKGRSQAMQFKLKFTVTNNPKLIWFENATFDPMWWDFEK